MRVDDVFTCLQIFRKNVGKFFEEITKMAFQIVQWLAIKDCVLLQV